MVSRIPSVGITQNERSFLIVTLSSRGANANIYTKRITTIRNLNNGYSTKKPQGAHTGQHA
jgi:hypothetical protein